MLIKVKVFPSSKKEEILETGEKSFEIRVRARPVRGEANTATMKILADYFKVPLSKIKLIKGFRERNKFFEVRGVGFEHESYTPKLEERGLA